MRPWAFLYRRHRISGQRKKQRPEMCCGSLCLHVGDPDHHGGISGAPHRADRGMDRHVRGALHTGNLVSDSAVPGKMAEGMKWFCSSFEQNLIKRRCVFLNFHFS